MKVFQRESTVRTRRFPAIRQAAATLIVAAIALAGCTSGGTDATVAQARQDGAQAQAQKDATKAQQDTQASLAAEVQKLKDDAAKAAQAKATADKAAAQAAAQAAQAAAQASAAKTAADTQTSCGGTVSAGVNTSCVFAMNVASSYLDYGGGTATFDVWSPITSRYYTMSCTPGVTTVCRGGVNAVVYIR